MDIVVIVDRAGHNGDQLYYQVCEIARALPPDTVRGTNAVSASYRLYMVMTCSMFRSCRLYS